MYRCAEKSEHSGPDTAFPRKAYLQGWSLASMWEYGFGRVPSIPWSVTVPKLVQTVWLMLNACFPPGSLEFWCMLGRGYLHNHPPTKTLGTESLMSFRGRQHLTRAVAIQCWRNEVCPMCLHWEGSLGGCTWFPLGISTRTFSLGRLCFMSSCQNTSKAVSTTICQVLWVPPKESLNLGVGSGPDLTGKSGQRSRLAPPQGG